MKIFDASLLRLKQATKVTSDQEVAELLGMTKAALSDRKRRDSFPSDKLRALAQQCPELGIDVDYVLNGRASPMAFGTAKQIGVRLRNERLRINSSDADMAACIGCSLSDYMALEDGLRAPTANEVMALRQHDELDADLVLVGFSSFRKSWVLDSKEEQLLIAFRAAPDKAKVKAIKELQEAVPTIAANSTKSRSESEGRTVIEGASNEVKSEHAHVEVRGNLNRVFTGYKRQK